MKKGLLRSLSKVGGVLLIAVMAAISGWSATGDKGPDNATCLDCHDGYDKSLAATPHKLSSSGVAIACVDCHSGGNTHADNPSKENITNPVNLSGDNALLACASCHLPHQDLDSYGYNAHTLQQLNCASCHKLHSAAPVVGLLHDDNTEFCGSCHKVSSLGFMKRSNHPVQQGAMTCLSCHQFTKRADQNQAYGFARVCEDCHTDVAGPHRFEHAAMNTFDPQGSGCIECHNPHGSEHDQLLRQPVAQLCQSCHSIPAHRTAHDGAYAGDDCLSCHTDIHGSATERRFLAQNLAEKFNSISCYCHSLD